MTDLIGIKTNIKVPYDEALQRLTDSSISEDYRILTQIDVKQTFKTKLDVDFRLIQSQESAIRG